MAEMTLLSDPGWIGSFNYSLKKVAEKVNM